MRRRKGKDPKKLRGAARMKEFGYRKVDVWIDQAELVILLSACRMSGLGLATFIRAAAVDFCKEHWHPGGGRRPMGLHGTEPYKRQVNGPSSSSDHKSSPPAEG